MAMIFKSMDSQRRTAAIVWGSVVLLGIIGVVSAIGRGIDVARPSVRQPGELDLSPRDRQAIREYGT